MCHSTWTLCERARLLLHQCPATTQVKIDTQQTRCCADSTQTQATQHNKQTEASTTHTDTARRCCPKHVPCRQRYCHTLSPTTYTVHTEKAWNSCTAPHIQPATLSPWCTLHAARAHPTQLSTTPAALHGYTASARTVLHCAGPQLP